MFKDVEVITGTFGLINYFNGSGKPLSSPEFFWKILFDSGSHRAAAFVGLQDLVSKNGQIIKSACQLKCSKMYPWKYHFNLTTDLFGDLICCDLETLGKVVTFIPDLRNEDGLWPSLLNYE